MFETGMCLLGFNDCIIAGLVIPSDIWYVRCHVCRECGSLIYAVLFAHQTGLSLLLLQFGNSFNQQCWTKEELKRVLTRGLRLGCTCIPLKFLVIVFRNFQRYWSTEVYILWIGWKSDWMIYLAWLEAKWSFLCICIGVPAIRIVLFNLVPRLRKILKLVNVNAVLVRSPVVDIVVGDHIIMIVNSKPWLRRKFIVVRIYCLIRVMLGYIQLVRVLLFPATWFTGLILWFRKGEQFWILVV